MSNTDFTMDYFLLEVFGRTLISYSMCKPFSCWALTTSLWLGVKRTGINISDTESQLDDLQQTHFFKNREKLIYPPNTQAF